MKVKTYFRRGTRQTIYEDPLTRERKEGGALLLSCVRPFTEYDHPDLVVEQWWVRFMSDATMALRLVSAPKKQIVG